MFTGIIKNVVKLDRLKKNRGNIIFHLRLPFPVVEGDSISVNGTCLSVSKIRGKTSIFDISSETASRSNLSSLNVGDWLNIEPSLKVGDSIDGHLVYGHIDGTGEILNIKEMPDSSEFTIKYPLTLSRYIAKKGSVALDGVSLTVSEIKTNSFKVALIPYTLENTNLRYKRKGDILNIEVDPVARYLQRLMEFKE